MDVRQPIHTVYGGAQLFTSETVPKLARLALRSFDAFASDPFEFAAAVGVPEALAIPTTRARRTTALKQLRASRSKSSPELQLIARVYERVSEALRTRAIEDYRIDFEDGYGHRSESEEDGHAVKAAEETVLAMAQGTLPPFFGIRIKPLTAESRQRALRTLDLYLSRLGQQTSSVLPQQFVVTLPKVHSVAEVSECVRSIDTLERQMGFPAGSVMLEIMVETPTVLVNPEGRNIIRDLIVASNGRCRGMHLGLYDFLSFNDVVASAQSYLHPTADHLRIVTKLATAGTPVWLADGATNVIPVGHHRGPKLTPVQQAANRRDVHAGWATIFRHVDHSLRMGYYQGWDLHPSQIPPRFAAVFALFLREHGSASTRLRSFLDAAGQAMLRGQQFDDAATGQGLLNFFLRGLSCGAFVDRDLDAAGLTREELRTRSFAAIVAARRKRS